MSARFTFPVYGFDDRGMVERVASFFSDSDAADFVMHPERFGAEVRNLYMSEPRYDRRASGYRPDEPLLLDLQPRPLGDGSYQVAA